MSEIKNPFDTDYELIRNKGQILTNPYQLDKDAYSSPILLDGLVYKPFLKGAKKKEKLIRLLKELNWEYLSKIVGVSKEGYTYEYNDNPLLKDALKRTIDFHRRLKYIEELLKTDEFLVSHGITYCDYHSVNVLTGESICLLDQDGILRVNSENRRRIKEYLLDLIISIFINYDLTFNGDNTHLRESFAKFFNDNTLLDNYDLDLRRVFDRMASKNNGDALELQDTIKRF